MSRIGVAYKKVKDLEELAAVPADGDFYVVVDTSDGNKEKKLSASRVQHLANLREDALSLLSDTTGGITALTDMSVADIQTLFTVPTGKTCILSHAIVEVSGDAGAALVMTIGSGAAAADFVGTTNGDNLDADGDAILMAPVPSATPATLKAYAAGTVISLDIATAGNATTGSVYLFGILY